ncbi:MAG: murein biosynthesis integral membrane protein MurJ, partial [Candidatus Beckwithbacteria bacterium]
SLLIMGGISIIFLPVFSEYLKKNEEEGWKLASNVLNCFLVLLIVICSILAIFTPFLIKLVTPGFNPEQKELVISLTRIMFLSPILLGMSSLFSGVLHYFNRFFAYSIAPILYNLSIIFGILVFVPRFGVQGLAYGVILGAILHLLVQLPAAKASGFKYLPIFNFRSSGLKRIFKLMIPRTIGTFAFNINLIIITAIGSTLAVGSIAIFNFANNIQHFPIGIIGASFAVASFPVLSRAWVNGQRQEFLESFSSSLRQILFLIIPASLFIFLIRAQIVRLLLGTGEFGWQDTRLTAASLGLFCFGIFAFACIPFLARVFYSFHDTKTPVIISLVSMALSISLCFSFVWLLGFLNPFQQFLSENLKLLGIEEIAVVGLPLALSISAIFQFCLLLFFLRKKLGHIRLTEIRSSIAKSLIGTVLMGVAVYFSLRGLASLVEMETFAGVLAQTIWAGLIGIFVYTIVTNILKSPEVGVMKSSILGQFTKKA